MRMTNQAMNTYSVLHRYPRPDDGRSSTLRRPNMGDLIETA
jgi:hypothetical protein